MIKAANVKVDQATHNLYDAQDYGATMVAGAPRLLLARNTQLTFGSNGVPLLRAPLFGHTPP
jgi:hypothetical protein